MFTTLSSFPPLVALSVVLVPVESVVLDPPQAVKLDTANVKTSARLNNLLFS